MGKIIPTKVAREEPGALDATILFIPVTANEHCLDIVGESTHYPDPHCTKKSEEAHDTGHEDHPHSGVSRPTERLESAEESPLGNITKAITEEAENGEWEAMPESPEQQGTSPFCPNPQPPTSTLDELTYCLRDPCCCRYYCSVGSYTGSESASHRLKYLAHCIKRRVVISLFASWRTGRYLYWYAYSSPLEHVIGYTKIKNCGRSYVYL